MFKRKTNFITILLVILFLLSPVCLATSEETLSEEDLETTIDSEETELTDEEMAALLAEYDETDSEADAESEANFEEALISDDYYSSFSDKTFFNYTLKYEEKILDGNVFLIGNDVIIDTDIYGDLFVIANKFTITERARACANVFVIANTVNIDGLAYDLYAKCINLTVSENGAVYRDLRVTAKNITMLGQIGRNMIVTSNDLIFASSDSETGAEAAGIVYNDLKYNTVKNITIPQSVVQNEIIPVTSRANTVWGYFLTALSIILYIAALYFVITLLAPKFVEKIAGYVPNKLLLSSGLGVLAFIVPGILATVLYLTTVGTVLAGIIVGIIAVLFALSLAIVSIPVGMFVSKLLKKESKYIALGFSALVALVIWGLGFIPYVGIVITKILVPVLGTGMFVLTFIKKKEKKETTV